MNRDSQWQTREEYYPRTKISIYKTLQIAFKCRDAPRLCSINLIQAESDGETWVRRLRKKTLKRPNDNRIYILRVEYNEGKLKSMIYVYKW